MFRLAYVRFETDDRNQAALTEAIACGGLGEPGFFSDRVPASAYTAIDTQGSRAFVVFRGTQPDDPFGHRYRCASVLVDWQAQGKVHLGFRDALHSVLGPFRRLLEVRARNLGHRS